MQALYNYLTTTPLEEVLNMMKKLQVGVKKVGLYGQLYLFNYEDESPRGHPIVDGCRGTVWQYLDNEDAEKSSKWICVRSAMDRFFNVNEIVDGVDTSVLPGNLIVQEKLDGSLALLYWNSVTSAWTVGTRNSFDCSEIPVRGNLNMKQIFDLALTSDSVKTSVDAENATKSTSKLNLPEELRKYTFLFELCSAYNQVVVYHSKPTLTLLSVRSNVYPFPELDPKDFRQHFRGATTPEKFEFKDLDACRAYVEQRGGESFEGLVLVQGTVEVPRRLKLKSKAFVTLAHSKGVNALPEEQILAALLKGSNELAELLTYYPIWTETANKIQKLLTSFRESIAQSQKLVDDLGKEATRAQVAAVANKSVCKQYFFTVLSKKATNLDDYMKGQDIATVLNMIRYSN